MEIFLKLFSVLMFLVFPVLQTSVVFSIFLALILFCFLFFIDVTGGEEVDESVEEETRLNRSIGISKEKAKKKKKIRKVMSWNF